MTREFIDFVLTHENEDTARLLLSASRYPSIDMPSAVQQIEGRRTAREKWPSLLACEEFLYPPRLNREQASSETTAWHKVHVANELCGEDVFLSVADLTGGMGIDSIAFAQREKRIHPLRTQVITHVDYVERDKDLCSLVNHNCQALELKNLDVHCGDSLQWLASNDRKFDIIYIDPARRSKHGQKVSAFEDCEPNILTHMEPRRSRCRWLMVKASPMIDPTTAEQQLGDVAEIHIVSVKGECKEVLFICGEHTGETMVHCVVYDRPGQFFNCDFTRSEEASAEPHYCSAIGQYLYEPDAALMKGGPYNLICQWLGVEKLARNTHLYTSNRFISDFYGRTFHVLQELKLNHKAVAEAIPSGRAHVVTRNYPTEAATLQRQLGLKEGGDVFVVATTVGTRPRAFLCTL